MQQVGVATMAKKKAKKRGVKPGTKRGPYKKKGRKKIVAKLSPEGWKIGEKIKVILPKDFNITDGPAVYAPKQPLTLCGQLEDSILLLEQRISNAIAKINSLM